MDTVNQRVKHVRNLLGFSQSIFSEQLGISQASLSDIERGRTEVNNKILIELITKYEINSNWLLTGNGNIYIAKNDSQNGIYADIDIVNEINQNKRKINIYYQRVLDIYDLYIKLLKYDKHDSGQKEQDLVQNILKEEFLINNGIEYYETLNFEEKFIYDEELKKVADYLLDSFFSKFKFIYTKLAEPKVYEMMKKYIERSFQ